MIEDALRASLALAIRLEREFAAAANNTRSPAASRQVSKLTLAIAKQMRADAEQLLASVQQGGIATLTDVVSLNQRAQAAEELHSHVENGAHHALHPVLSPTVRAELEKLGVNGEVLVSGTQEVSYEIWPFPKDRFLGLVPDDELDQFAFPLLVFRVPNAPLDWPLQHVLLYHEIGHALLDAKEGLPSLALPPDRDPSKAKTPDESLDLLDRANEYRDVSKNWLEEIHADAVGVLLAGPAYAVAFARLLGGFFAMNAAIPTHPPLSLRIQLIDQALKRYGFVQPPAFKNLLDGWLAMAKNAKTITSELLEQELVVRLVDDIVAAFPSVLALAEKHVDASRYTPAFFEEDLVRGASLANLHLPPIEVDEFPSLEQAGTPLPPARIFSAAWAGYLIDKEPEIEERYADVVLGSLEGAEALRVWSKK